MKDVFEVEKGFSFLKTSKSPTHNFYSTFNLSVVSFDCIVIMFQSVFVASNWNPKRQFGNAREKYAPCYFVVSKFIADKSDKFSFSFRLVFSV